MCYCVLSYYVIFYYMILIDIDVYVHALGRARLGGKHLKPQRFAHKGVLSGGDGARGIPRRFPGVADMFSAYRRMGP